MRGVRKFFLITLVLGTHLNSYLVLSQNVSVADSLINELSNAQDDSLRFEILKRIAFSHPDPGQSLSFSLQALELANSLGDRILIARALEEVSLSQRMLGNKILSFRAAFEALNIYDSLKMRSHQATLYIQIGSNYAIEKDFPQAIAYLLLGRNIHKTLHRDYDVAIAEINVGETYRLMGNLDSAEWYTNKALIYGKDFDYPQIIGYTLGNLGMIHAHGNELVKALHELTESIEILTKLGDAYSVSVYQSELGLVYEKLGEDKKCRDLLNQAFVLANNNRLKEQIKDISYQLFTFHEARKEYNEALRFHKIFKAYEDSLINLENVKGVEQLKAKYEFEKKDKEIAQQEVKIREGIYARNIVFVVAILLTVIIFISILAYLRKKKDNEQLILQKKQIEEREEQEKWLLNELQHRTKNNLQMISSLLNLQSRQLVGHPSYEAIKDGQLRVDALAIIHQRLYQEGSQLKITLHDYLVELVENLVYSFNDKVEVKFEIEHFEVDVDKAVPLALIVNELVTNALKHAYENEEHPKLVVGFGKQDNETLVLEVADNGQGLKEMELDKGNSFGLKLVKSLAAQLNATIQAHGSLEGCHWRIKLGTDVIN